MKAQHFTPWPYLLSELRKKKGRKSQRKNHLIFLDEKKKIELKRNISHLSRKLPHLSPVTTCGNMKKLETLKNLENYFIALFINFECTASIQDGRKAHFFLQIPFLSLNLFDKGKCVFLRWFSFHFHFAMSKQNCLMMMMVLLMPEREIFYHSSLNNIWLFKKNDSSTTKWFFGDYDVMALPPSFYHSIWEREKFVKTFSQRNYTIL